MHSTTKPTPGPRTDCIQGGAGRLDGEQDDAPIAGLKLDFRSARLDTVLDYLHKSAGLIIHVKPNVRVGRTVDLWHDKPVNKAEALQLLNQVLTKDGCTLIQKGSVFSVISSEDLKKNCILLPAL